MSKQTSVCVCFFFSQFFDYPVIVKFPKIQSIFILNCIFMCPNHCGLNQFLLWIPRSKNHFGNNQSIQSSDIRLTFNRIALCAHLQNLRKHFHCVKNSTKFECWSNRNEQFWWNESFVLNCIVLHLGFSNYILGTWIV